MELAGTFHLSSAARTILWISFLAGAVHVMAPDHWLPASVVAWQRRWRTGQAARFAAFAFAFHILLGAFVYFIFDTFLRTLDSGPLFFAALGLVSAVMFVRMYRFSRVREVLRAGPGSSWGMIAVFSLLGPCESIIPIMIKSGQVGIGFLTPILAFTAGTLVSGTACVLVGRYLWDQPVLLPRGISLAQTKIATMPLFAVLMLGLATLLRV
jgi:hypothetical protein